MKSFFSVSFLIDFIMFFGILETISSSGISISENYGKVITIMICIVAIQVNNYASGASRIIEVLKNENE